MFLIEYSKGRFINGDDIQWLDIGKDIVTFGLKGDSREEEYCVSGLYQASFVNHVQMLNHNLTDVETTYIYINKEYQ